MLRCEKIFVIGLLLCLLPSSSCLQSAFSSRPKKVYGAEEEKAKDNLGFEAIQILHKQMDDDHSGSVTLEESSDFVMEELHVKEKERVERRQQNFHLDNDETITVEELWHRWLRSKERNWTVDDTVQWLQDIVELPQYVETFQKNAVDGRTLPRFAMQNASFLVNVLGISNPIHRQKLHLKAMDVVLFGQRKTNNIIKDVAMMILLMLAISFYCMSRFQRATSQKELNKLAQKMDKLRGMEQDFNLMQNRISEERRKQDEISNKAEAQEIRKGEQIQNLKVQLEAAERRLEEGTTSYAPLALQPLLRRTCEYEMANIGRQKRENFREMREAMQLVEKMRRKQYSVMSSLKMAVGSGTETENLDQKILEIKQKMETLAATMEECEQRWTQVESLCGFPVLGLASPPVRSFPSSTSNGINRIPSQHSLALAAMPAAAYSIPNLIRDYPSLMRIQPQSTIQEVEEDLLSHHHGIADPSPPASLLHYAQSEALLHMGKLQPPNMVSLGGRLTGPVRSTASMESCSRQESSTSSQTQSIGRLPSPQQSTLPLQPRFQLGPLRSDSNENIVKVSEVGSVTSAGVTRHRKAPSLADAGKSSSQDSSGSGGSGGKTELLNPASGPAMTKKKSRSFLAFVGPKKKEKN